jgi:NAD dependent epimerase/dehydratase family enzyme
MLGEMASAVTDSTNVSSEKIRIAGFVFEFEKIENALNDLISR